MEAAADTVRQLSKSILPDRPHQLAKSLDWKSRYHPDEPSPTGSSARCEEWQDLRLQYMTLLTDADRGTLFTRGYCDIRSDPPPKPTLPKDVGSLARSSAPKKTLSLSDYKNKKTSTSPLPSSNTPTPTHPPTSSNPPRSSAPSASEPRQPSHMDSVRRTNDGASHTPRSRLDTDHMAVDMRLPPKPPSKSSLPAKPPTPDTRKRIADGDDGSRPPKRPRPSDTGSRAGDDRTSHLPRDCDRDDRDDRDRRDEHRRTDRDALPNGRPKPKTEARPPRPLSPPSRPRGNSINGSKHPPADSHLHTPTKADANKPSKSSKSALPPLLSPLRLNIDDQDSHRLDKKRRETGPDATVKAKPPRASDAHTNPKPPPSPPRLPPLLSPTLPPEVEAELDRRRRASPISTGRDRIDEDRPDDYKRRKTFVVTLKVPKKLRGKFRRLMGQSPLHEEPSSAPAPSHKTRPAAGKEQLASKKPRAYDQAKVSDRTKAPAVPPPSTPSKKGTTATAMSRVSSSASATRTPGGAGAGPTSGAPAADPLVTAGSFSTRAGTTLSLKECGDVLQTLGRAQKRLGDGYLKREHGDLDEKTRGIVLMLESITAFIGAFHAHDAHRLAASKTCDPSQWHSLFPLIEVLQRHISQTPGLDGDKGFLYSVSLFLQLTAYERLLEAWASHEDPSDRISLKTIMRLNRTCRRVKTQYLGLARSFDRPLRLEQASWEDLEVHIADTLRALSLWCARQGVEWKADPKFGDAGILVPDIRNGH